MSFGRFLRPLLLSLPLLTAGASVAAPAQEYSVAVLPVLPPAEVKRRWQPVLDETSRRSGLPLRFRFYADYPRFEDALLHDEVDFAVTSPVQTWTLRHHYRPLLHDALPLVGLVVTRRDSPLQSLADLRQHTLSLQEGSSLSANLFVAAELRTRKIDVTLQPVNSESSALHSMLLGKSDAAVTDNYLLKLLPPGITGQVRSIYQAPPLPAPAIVANLRTPADVAERFRQALLQLRGTQPALLDSILMPDISDADLERDYGSIGKLLATEGGDEAR